MKVCWMQLESGGGFLPTLTVLGSKGLAEKSWSAISFSKEVGLYVAVLARCKENSKGDASAGVETKASREQLLNEGNQVGGGVRKLPEDYHSLSLDPFELSLPLLSQQSLARIEIGKKEACDRFGELLAEL